MSVVSKVACPTRLGLIISFSDIAYPLQRWPSLRTDTTINAPVFAGFMQITRSSFRPTPAKAEGEPESSNRRGAFLHEVEPRMRPKSKARGGGIARISSPVFTGFRLSRRRGARPE